MQLTGCMTKSGTITVVLDGKHCTDEEAWGEDVTSYGGAMILYFLTNVWLKRQNNRHLHVALWKCNQIPPHVTRNEQNAK